MKKITKMLWLPILVAFCIIGLSVFAACDGTDLLTQAEALTQTTAQTEVVDTNAEETATTSDETNAEAASKTATNEEEANEESATNEEQTSEPEETNEEVAASEQQETGYVITFITDENVTIAVYDTQELIGAGTTDTVYARNGSTGEILTDGNGQVNFVLTVGEGYEIGSVQVVGTYKNLKTPADTGTAAYRITKIESDLTVTVSVNELGTRYTATFSCGEGVRAVLVSDTQDMTEAVEATSAYARDKSGEILSDGNGQVNFIVVLEDGYSLDQVTVEGTYKNLKNDPEETGATDYYRITKIASDLTVTVTATK